MFRGSLFVATVEHFYRIPVGRPYGMIELGYQWHQLSCKFPFSFARKYRATYAVCKSSVWSCEKQFGKSIIGITCVIILSNKSPAAQLHLLLQLACSVLPDHRRQLRLPASHFPNCFRSDNVTASCPSRYSHLRLTVVSALMIAETIGPHPRAIKRVRLNLRQL